tara:strand:- start:175 stop:639 length:465 start_codon:yes stop_codon:yes gene_type:complete
MLTAECIKCGENFRKFSTKSRDRVCHDCKRVKPRNYKQVAKVVEVTNSDLEARVIAMEKSLDALHTVIGVQINQTVGHNVESIVGDVIDKKFSELQATLSSSMTKNKRTTMYEVKKMLKEDATTKAIGILKTRLTTHMKAIEALREEIEDIHNQ